MQNVDNSQEILETDNEILLPKNTIRAFGRALRVIFTEHEKKIKEGMSSMETDPLANKDDVGKINKHIEKINDIILEMQKSKEVKIVKAKNGYSRQGGNDFEFSQESEEQIVPRNEEIILSPELTHQMILGMTHTFFNPLTPINAFLELIKTESQAGETRNRSSSTLLEIFSGITSTLRGIAEADKWKLVTDQNGKTTIVSLPRPAESQ